MSEKVGVRGYLKPAASFHTLDDCDEPTRTPLWNEYIATPVEIVELSKL